MNPHPTDPVADAMAKNTARAMDLVHNAMHPSTPSTGSGPSAGSEPDGEPPEKPAPPKPKTPLERTQDAWEEFMFNEPGKAQAIEKRLAWPEAVEILCDLEEELAAGVRDGEDQPDRNARAMAAALQAVMKWARLRQERRESLA